jgi:hypothetical protein
LPLIEEDGLGFVAQRRVGVGNESTGLGRLIETNNRCGAPSGRGCLAGGPGTHQHDRGEPCHELIEQRIDEAHSVRRHVPRYTWLAMM